MKSIKSKLQRGLGFVVNTIEKSVRLAHDLIGYVEQKEQERNLLAREQSSLAQTNIQ
ncbi:MAG: hypothetical protein IJ849_07075 [Selenomonadaceae bacterium]|nr:hypothetical protein [Selenomonadaceae bacterium]